MPPYTGNILPVKPYRQITQVMGKEIRVVLKVILAVFTASLHRNKKNFPLAQALRRIFHQLRHLEIFNASHNLSPHTLPGLNGSANNIVGYEGPLVTAGPVP